MFYIITGRSLNPERQLVVDVSYWANEADFDAQQPPARTNDFVIGDASATRQAIVRDASRRYKKVDGSFVVDIGEEDHRDLYEWESVRRNLFAEVEAEIVAYWDRAELHSYPEEHDNPRIVRSEVDRGGILAEFDR